MSGIDFSEVEGMVPSSWYLNLKAENKMLRDALEQIQAAIFNPSRFPEAMDALAEIDSIARDALWEIT